MVDGCVLSAFNASAELDVTAGDLRPVICSGLHHDVADVAKVMIKIEEVRTTQCLKDLYIASVRYGASGSSMTSVYDASGASSQGPFSAASRISGSSWVSSSVISFPRFTSAPLG